MYRSTNWHLLFTNVQICSNFQKITSFQAEGMAGGQSDHKDVKQGRKKEQTNFKLNNKMIISPHFLFFQHF